MTKDFGLVVEAQRAFFRSGATRSIEFRREQLLKLLHAIQKHEPILLQALQADLGKSPYQAFTTEIGLVLSEIRCAARLLPAWMKPQKRRTPWIAWPSSGLVRPEPYGVALIVGPWNYPFQLLLAPLVGAIAAGNCAVLKPSEYAPHTAAAIAQLMGDAFPQEYLAVVQGGPEVAENLLAERFDTIFFTGSTNVGRIVMAAAARHLTPITLELGGKCPCLVCSDAPLEVTARRIVWGKFMNAGQTCVAPDYILVDRHIRGPLLDALVLTIKNFYGDDPQRCPDYGRIINRRHWERLTAYLGSGLIVHGGQSDATDLYLAPTILTEMPLDARVMQEEIFGPILPVLEFKAVEEALTLLRDRPAPLALYLFTRDKSTQDRVLAETRSGGVCINDTILHMIGKDLPFGGLGDSGLGAYHGRASFDCFTHRRAVMRRSLGLDPKLRYPPPRISLATMKRAFRFLLGA